MNRSSATAALDAKVLMEKLLALMKAYPTGSYRDEAEDLENSLFRIFINKTA